MLVVYVNKNVQNKGICRDMEKLGCIYELQILTQRLKELKKDEIHSIFCSIESNVLYLYYIKIKAYEIILFKCRTA